MTNIAVDTSGADALDASLFGEDPGAASIETATLISAMVQSGRGISDLIFSPNRPPQVEQHGELVPVSIDGLPALTTGDTCRIARDVLGRNLQAMRALKEHGACDVSYAIQDAIRFRVNVFRQRGTYAVVMRLIASKIPTFAELQLSSALEDVAALKNGLVLVTGQTGSGKSSTLAAIIDRINETRAEHIITIEDPIEFLHLHKKATVHQRELHSDTPTFASALRSALRQAPKVILVGEMRDRETIEVALTAAETGHLVFSTLHTIDASKTVERVVGTFESGEQAGARARLAGCFQYIISQRLLPKKGGGRIAALEILKATLRTREYLEGGEGEGKTLLDAMRDGELDGMQTFDMQIEKLVRSNVISMATGLLYATNPGNLRVELADVPEDEDSLITR